jgi:hypothetical protein
MKLNASYTHSPELSAALNTRTFNRRRFLINSLKAYHEDVWGSGRIAARILSLGTKSR